MAESSRKIDIYRADGDQRSSVDDVVAIEEPLEIQVSADSAEGAAAKSISITMRTPGNDEELAIGFLVTEGIIRSAADIEDVGSVGQPDEVTGLRNSVRVTLATGVPIDLDRLQRHFYTTSSCGVCGKASLDALEVAGAQSLAEADVRFSGDMLLALPGRIRHADVELVRSDDQDVLVPVDVDVEVRAGDVLLVRTGWYTVFQNDRALWESGEPGPDASCTAWLKEKDIIAIGADNAGVEAYEAKDRDPTGARLHITALRDLGVYLIEHVDLEELARDQVYEFLFIAAPLRLPGATGSPMTPLAMV